MMQSKASDVKRPYRMAARADRARATRRRIVEAAVSLMSEQGYVAVTIDAIAAEAGVSRRTVFTSVGSKLDALKLALDWAATGDDAGVALRERPEVRAIAAETDPERCLQLWAELTIAISARLAVPSRILTGAAAADPQARALRERAHRQRLHGQRAFARHLRTLYGTDPGAELAVTADTLWWLSDPATYDALIHERGWSHTRFRAWLITTARHHLQPDRKA